MATLTALKFQSADGAEHALDILRGLQQQQLITIHDAATVSWPAGKKSPKTRQATNLAGVGALDGAFWGMLFGLIFFVPLFGMAIGAAMGALSGKFADYGIDDNFIKQVREQVTEGTSALFIMTSGAVRDRVIEQMQGTHPEIIATNLPEDQETELREAFGVQFGV